MSGATAIRRLASETRASFAWLAEGLGPETPVSFVPSAGSLGEAAINVACWRFLTNRFERVELCALDRAPAHRDVFLAGGSHLVEPLHGESADFLLRLPLEHRPRLFPSTIFGHRQVFERWGPRLRLVCRDLVSLTYARGQVGHGQLRLGHDAAFALEDWLEQTLAPAPRPVRTESGRFFRRDREALGLAPAGSEDPLAAFDGPWLDMAEAEAEVLLLAHRISRCRQVATDRLQGAILAALLGCEATLHANAWFENEAVHDHSLAAAGVAFVPGTVPANPALDPLRHLLTPSAGDRRQASA